MSPGAPRKTISEGREPVLIPVGIGSIPPARLTASTHQPKTYTSYALSHVLELSLRGE